MTARLAVSLAAARSALFEKRPSIEWLSRITAILLTAVLVLSAMFAIEVLKVTHDVATRIEAVRMMTGQLRTAQYSLLTEQSLQQRYLASPSGDTFIAHRVAASALVSALLTVRSTSDASDRRIVDEILAAHRLYLESSRRLFVAANREDKPLVAAIERDRVDPAFAQVDDAIDARTKAQAAIASRVEMQLLGAQTRAVDAMVALSLVGILCLGCFLVILRSYRARIRKSHEAEVCKLERAALIDGLTGIGNHRAYKLDLIREIARAERHDEPLTLALLDIDDFKVVNDRDGHMQGDCVLEQLAVMLASHRTEDRAYRVGGDEFALILAHTSIEAAQLLVARLQLEAPARLFGNTLSIGLATLNGSGCDAEGLQARADAAMYAAKRSGRNCITTFDELVDGMWLLSPAKVHDLRQLIASRAVNVVFQPIWDLQQGRILAYEALARPDPRFGFNGPQEAFDLAERTGRAHELDAVCRSAAIARSSGLPQDALLFVNVSPQSLDHGRLNANDLLAEVRAAGLTPERVVIEITERSITQVEAVIVAARELQSHGFRLALDDTGAGNSGLEMLSRLPLEFVKIDREVVVKALVDKKARGVVAGIVAIAKATDAYIIAEGIETTEMLEFVSEFGRTSEAPMRGIHGAQGYLLLRPQCAFRDSVDTDATKALLERFNSERHASLV